MCVGGGEVSRRCAIEVYGQITERDLKDETVHRKGDNNRRRRISCLEV